MSHEHEAVYLAVASLDFELTPDERRRMEAGLAECPECAEIASSHGDLARLLDRLPVHDASPQVRQRILRAALVPPRDRNRWPVLLVAAALLGLTMAAAAAVGAFRERSALDGRVVAPSASLPALGDLESPLPSSSAAPGSTDVLSGPGFGGPLAPDTITEVVSGRLRIRSAPRVAEDSIKHEPLLDVGDRLLILDGPVVASDYEWYLVKAWRPGNLHASWPVGWVSRGDHDGSTWIRPSVDPCPTGTITMAVVESLRPQERVACFGDRPLRLRAFVYGDAYAPCVPEPDAPCVEGPLWLAGSGGLVAEVDRPGAAAPISGPPLAVDPDDPPRSSGPPAGGMMDLEGAFDHPAARDCRPGAKSPGVQPIEAAVARLQCRERFVVTSVRSDPEYPMANLAAVTVTDDLRVRSQPGLTNDRLELLPSGTRVWVIDGPVVAADYEWFEVVVPSVDAGDGAPRVGWVAASDHGAERWLARAAVSCPGAGSLEVADLMRLTSPGGDHEGLACFGSLTIRFQGTIGLECGVEDRPGWSLTPEWLSANSPARIRILDGDDVVVARPRPGLGLPVSCGENDTKRFAIGAHFDDAAASECDATVGAGEAARDLAKVAVYWCRTTLVIDDLTPAPQ